MLCFYNSLIRQKETFKSLKPGLVTMYNCGPTVYNYAHIGNLRSFLLADLLHRYLEWRGYKVKQIINITDVGHMTTDSEAGEDKIEMQARKTKQTPEQIATFYTKAFFEDLETVNIKRAWKYPKATEHIKEMINLIQKLIKNGHAYEVNGSVYFDLNTFPAYGKLSGNTVQDLLPGARLELIPEKRHPYDFVLWIKDPKHLMQWKSPWGMGYPGWHIECSAMSIKYLGKTIDIHTGGEDNKFPHHECEIAQSEGATGKFFVKYWLHIKHLMVEGKKMSKSLGNFWTLADVLAKGFSPRAVRYLLLSSHYRDNLNFTLEGLKAAEATVARFDELWTRLASSKSGNGLQSLVQETREDFIRAMDDDLNISKALAVVHYFVNKVNAALAKPSTKSYKLQAIKSVKKLFKEMVTDVLGIPLQKRVTEEVPAKIKKLVEQREKARKAKDWAKADELRQEIQAAGYVVEDTTEGSKVVRKVAGL